MINYVAIPNLEFIPDNATHDDNHLFNCNTNSLMKFFPPKGLQLPKDIRGIIDITKYLSEFKEYEERFNKDMEEIDQFGDSNLYYSFMKDDLGIIYDTIEDKTLNPIRIMYRYNCDNLFTKLLSLDSFDKENIKKIIWKLYSYGISADMARSFTKDEIKRMRLSVTALSKRLHKSIKNTLRLEEDALKELQGKVDTLIKYYRFILTIYEQYMEDKIFVARYIYNSLVETLAEYYILNRESFPIELCKMMDSVEEFKNKNGVIRL